MTTLSDIKTRARQLSDMENSNFIAEAELTSFANQSYLELYDLVIQSYEDYYISSTTFTISSGNTQALPTDLYKLKGVDILIGSDYYNVDAFTWEDRNKRNRISRVFPGRTDVQYRMVGGNLIFEPSDNAVGSYKIWYIPSLTQLVSSSDTLDSTLTRMGWDEYIAIDCAIKMREKEESDTSALERMKARITSRIVSAAANRDVGSSMVVSDVRSNNWDFDA